MCSSGEACRNWPFSSRNGSMCSSGITSSATSGVSTSRKPRSWKNSRSRRNKLGPLLERGERSGRNHDTACLAATRWPGKSGGIGQSSMSQMPRSNSASSTGPPSRHRSRPPQASTNRPRCFAATRDKSSSAAWSSLRPHFSAGRNSSWHFAEQLRPAFERELIVALAGPRERREQHRTRLAQLLQTVVHDLRRADLLELRPQVPQQNLMQRPLEQPQPLVGLHQLDEALRKLLILLRAQRSQRRAASCPPAASRPARRANRPPATT